MRPEAAALDHVGPRRVLPAGADAHSAESLQTLATAYGTPLLVVDLQRVRAQYHALAQALPGVDLHYALKPMPHAAVVSTLAALGSSFDLATTGEIDVVRRAQVTAARCIHTHPIKRDIDIRNALHFGVTTFVVDNVDELRKFERFRAQCSVLVRVSFRASSAICDLSRKFGCEPEGVEPLLELAARLGVRVCGFSFHVGSQALDADMYVRAIHTCREFLGIAERHAHLIEVLDIGGGFPIDYGLSSQASPPSIHEFCEPIRRALDAWPARVRRIAEPGRFIVAPAGVAVCSVMGRALRGAQWWYYLDDGLYSSYSGQLYDHARYPIDALKPRGPRLKSVLAGPTCDSIDVIAEDVLLPQLKAGDLLIGRNMGAYTWASATDFNYFPKALVMALDEGLWIE